jgi:hypothetical protein
MLSSQWAYTGYSEEVIRMADMGAKQTSEAQLYKNSSMI